MSLCGSGFCRFADGTCVQEAEHEFRPALHEGEKSSKTEALVYYEWTCLGDGYGHYYLMRFQYGRWMRVMREIDFIS